MSSNGPAACDRVLDRRRAVALARHFREAEGLSIAQIADRLGRSPATIKAYFYDLDLPRFRRHLGAFGRKLRKGWVWCRERGRRIRRSFVVRWSGWLSWGTSRQRRLAKDLGISDVTLRNWLKEEKAANGGRPGGLSGEEREELARLRDENATLRMEREILRKAAVFFAREDGGR